MSDAAGYACTRRALLSQLEQLLVTQLPNTVNVSFRGLASAQLMPLLEPLVACSAGSACHSGEPGKLSPVLAAIDVPVEYGLGTLRLSIGRYTTENDIDVAITGIKKAVTCLLAR